VPAYELIVCDDGSSADERRQIMQLGADRFIWNDRVGYGRNANSGMHAATGEFIFHLEDDLIIVRRGHFLKAAIEVVGSLPELGYVKFQSESIEKRIPKLRARRDVGEYRVDVLPFPSPHAEGLQIYRYTNRPHVKHRRFHEIYGLYPEGYSPFETELLFARRVNANRGSRIGWIHNSVVFRHFGIYYGSNSFLRPLCEPVPYDPEAATQRRTGEDKIS
jgi:glycosyltransferase involved in cell wall biosynthesis